MTAPIPSLREATSPPPLLKEAMRSNTGKSELAYLLTFDGAIDMWIPDSRLRFPLSQLALWYRGFRDGDGTEQDSQNLQDACAAILAALRPDWGQLMAQTAMAGAIKYSRGNYLKGRKLHDTCNSLLRHVEKVELLDEEIDPELNVHHDGPIAWNTCFLLHCYYNVPGCDDRIRCPE